MSNVENDKIFEDDIDRIKRPKRKEPQPKAQIANATIIDESTPAVKGEVKQPKPKERVLAVSNSEENKEMRLRFGQSLDRKQIYISEKSRFANVLILGAKNSGKSSTVLPMLARQDILNKDCGMTFVVDKKDVAYTLYAMAKEAGRKVVILKPSANFDIANDFIQRTKYDYDYINENVINYKDAIKKKTIIIIDMEYAKYRQNAIRATAMLLMQLQIDMQDTQYTLKRPHFVYIDDSHRYLPFVELLLTSGDDYGMGTVLFLQGRAQLTMYETDYSSLVDVNVRNTILMNGITFEDAKYYEDRFFDFTIRDLLDRKEGQVMYEIVDSQNTRATGKCGLVFVNETIKKSIEEKAKKARKQLNKYSRKVELEISMREEQELNKLNKLKQEMLTRAANGVMKDDSQRIANEILITEEKRQKNNTTDEPVISEIKESLMSVTPEVAPLVEESEQQQQDIPEQSLESEDDVESQLATMIEKTMEEDLLSDDDLLGLSDLSDAGNELIASLSGLEEMGIPDDSFSAYVDDSDSADDIDGEDDEVSDISVIQDARKSLSENEDDVIELNETIAIDSLGDEYLRQTRGYKPIRANLPRKQKSIIASERYINDMLNKKLK